MPGQLRNERATNYLPGGFETRPTQLYNFCQNHINTNIHDSEAITQCEIALALIMFIPLQYQNSKRVIND